MPQVLMICKASLHEKSRQSMGHLCTLSSDKCCSYQRTVCYSKGNMGSLLHTLQISYGLLTKELLAEHLSITYLAQFSVTFPTNHNTCKTWKQPKFSCRWTSVGNNSETMGTPFGFVTDFLSDTSQKTYIQVLRDHCGIPFSGSCFGKCAELSEALRTLICEGHKHSEC